jgi:hypothetical protein
MPENSPTQSSSNCAAKITASATRTDVAIVLAAIEVECAKITHGHSSSGRILNSSSKRLKDNATAKDYPNTRMTWSHRSLSAVEDHLRCLSRILVDSAEARVEIHDRGGTGLLLSLFAAVDRQNTPAKLLNMIMGTIAATSYDFTPACHALQKHGLAVFASKLAVADLADAAATVLVAYVS